MQDVRNRQDIEDKTTKNRESGNLEKEAQTSKDLRGINNETEIQI